ncbi:DUF4381 domain-containing protein [Vibrio sp. RM-69-4]|uniref:DUF4381 domain-containing protein n=1 Tax=Vibrio sp. RM-69-4 TaxID=2950157 RepID=UPI00215C1B08|nr:DUF4381 domain-containing protein [Vibrio sp. RM-69-4]MCR9423929.1 DUF4381 domain-containing protein [Vibrio sp. RM-69-4]
MKESSIATLLDLSAMQLPELPSWFPLAWGWWASAAGILLCLLILVFVIRWRRKRLAPKKTALRLLNPQFGHLTPSSAIELLRQAALCYYPRMEIAHLTGKEWYTFLDSQISYPLFVPNETLWQQALYQKQKTENSQELINHCYQWVNDALPPKKRR